MKIVFVLENYIPHIGGVEILFKHICEDLAKDNEVVVITHRFKGTSKEETINNVKVRRITVPSIGARYFISPLAIVAFNCCGMVSSLITALCGSSRDEFLTRKHNSPRGDPRRAVDVYMTGQPFTLPFYAP